MMEQLQFVTMANGFVTMVTTRALLSVHTGVDGGMVTVYDNGSHFMAVVVLHDLSDVGPR